VETVSVNMTELKSIIRDAVAGEMSSRMEEATGRAVSEAKKAAADPAVFREMLDRAKAAVSTTDLPRATVDRTTLQVIHDPLKGKGLSFARSVKAMVVGILDRCSPADVARAWAAKGFAQYEEIAVALDAQARAFLTGAAASGGTLVPTAQAAEVIELLYPRTVALVSGVRTMEFTGAVNLGKINSGATIGYTGEAGLMTPSQPGTGELRMSGKKAYGLVPVSNEMLRNPAVGADALIRDDLLKALAVRRDLSFYRGAGNTFQPKGMKGWINSANSNAMTGTPTAATKIADLVKAIGLVDGADVQLDESAGFVMAPRTHWALVGTTDANSNLLFAAMLAAGQLFGFMCRRTSSIPTNLGGGTESEVYFGSHGDAILGFDLANPLQVEAFPNGTYHDGSALVSGISTDMTPIRILEGHDVVLRHDKAFAMITGVTWA
jgi:HK97 family phage major capsid protein